MKQVVIFPGQGSQHVGMGESLFSKYQKYMETAKNVLGYDLAELCLSGPEERLNDTRYSQVAIYVVNALSYENWLESNNKPDIVLGHSIGQYNAMLAAGMFSFEDGLKLVKCRGELMGKYQQNGAMAAIMRISSSELKTKLRKIDNKKQIDFANYNSEYQTVIAGPQDAVDAAINALQEDDVYAVRLRTSGAFHSRYMAQAKHEFQVRLQEFDFKRPEIRLFCNVTSGDMTEPGIMLAEHLVSPVKWMHSVYNILDIDEDAEFIECGPGNTLTNILRYNKKEHTLFLCTV